MMNKITDDISELMKENISTGNQVANNVNKTTHLVHNIAFESEEQAQGIKQINNGIMQISDVVQSNSAIAEESAASSQELTVQVETLNTMIGKFNLRN